MKDCNQFLFYGMCSLFARYILYVAVLNILKYFNSIKINGNHVFLLI